MPEIEIFDDKSVMVGKRRKGKDETIEDAMKTMERFSDWLVAAQDASRNAWQQADAINAAMLYGMLTHLRDEIDELLALGGDDARNAFELFRGMKRPEQQPSEGTEKGG